MTLDSRGARGARPPARLVRVVRHLLAATFLLGAVGTFAELLLLGHTEGVWQLVPIVLLGIGAIALPAVAWRSTRAAVRAFQALMGLFVASGVLGVILHYRGNVEFELEMYPTLSGLGLVREALTGATPVLAPGAMAQLGLIGIALSIGLVPSRGKGASG